MALVREHKAMYSVESICAGLGIARASYYRRATTESSACN